MHEAADGEAIRSVIARLAHTADSAADLADYTRLFTENATWAFGDVVLTGRAALDEAARGRRASGLAGPGTSSRHVISTTAVELDGDRAIARSYWQFYVDTATAPRLDSMGAYVDHLVRTPDGWQVDRRDITPG